VVKNHCYVYSGWIFGTRSGGSIQGHHFQTLIPDQWIVNEIVDCWASVLNFEETKRSPSSPFRVFFGTCFVSGFL
jgi:hypothetical protein